jgi:short-subunit dehydrogenase
MRSQMMITGASGGLGKAFAVDCARRGWDLTLTDLDADRLQWLAEGLERAHGIRAAWFPADLTEAKARGELFSWLASRPVRFQGLLNIAGLDHEGMFLERSREQLREIVKLNIEATLEVTHALLAQRDPSLTFRIVTVASLAAFFPMPVKATYAASKRFLLDFSLALRDEVKPLGASVTVLCPAGLPTTESTRQAIEAQGLMGQLTTMNIGVVASRTLDKALAGQPMYVPGWINQSLRLAGAVMPAGLLSALVGQRWRAAQSRRKGQNRPDTDDRIFPELSELRLAAKSQSTANGKPVSIPPAAGR